MNLFFFMSFGNPKVYSFILLFIDKKFLRFKKTLIILVKTINKKLVILEFFKKILTMNPFSNYLITIEEISKNLNFNINNY